MGGPSFSSNWFVFYNITRHVQNAIEKEHAKIITCMKIIYFTINNDHSIISFESECQFLKILNTLDMHVNDEYGSYTPQCQLHWNFYGFYRSI